MMGEALTLPEGATIAALMRMTGIEILTTYGPDVYELVGRLQASGSVVRDGRSNADLALQAEARRKIALEGDCGVSDEYKTELEGTP
jgi:hypothetical protein